MTRGVIASVTCLVDWVEASERRIEGEEMWRREGKGKGKEVEREDEE